MSLYSSPPEHMEIDGKSYPLDTDFRTWISFQQALTEPRTEAEKAEAVYGLMGRLGLPPSQDALEAMVRFYVGESSEHTGGSERRPRAFDFTRDSEYIYSAFLGAYGLDLTTAHMHWWKFKALFKSLPDDCEISKIMRYRVTDLKDVPKEQRKFYREMKARYSLGGSSGPACRTDEEMRAYVKKRFAEAERRVSELQHM